jgi:hypothetical protein
MFYRKPGKTPGGRMIKYLIVVIKNLITDACGRDKKSNNERRMPWVKPIR